ncbi:hypothetical protein BABINDRAFT_162161 [Babjeviella inositovora NRRL Y-12698]|uniref:BOD1/SHG1 domain-containing protein n=1 Tax=Babjeviella inositovora NRRL Y-12698 TaxID=984486 RepID=A0A1E3QN11_9ASCO|nr:uncharacterized protein BABINDRAFT_162161 [Babjeviella inositovora NRRL Y-12698]ODQ79096.1 hypothetical protein BABINDRAFT_162161 [Babjeviella inositovora NRRL Y-12698]
MPSENGYKNGMERREETTTDGHPTITDPKQLTTVYKRSGAFDKQRKQLLNDFKDSETFSRVSSVIQQRIRKKVAKDPSLLAKNKGKIAALIQGEIINDPEVIELIEKDIRRRVFTAKESHNAVYNGLDDIQRTLLGLPNRSEDFGKETHHEERLSKTATRGTDKVDISSLY